MSALVDNQPAVVADIDIVGPLEEIKLIDDSPVDFGNDVISVDSASISDSLDALEIACEQNGGDEEQQEVKKVTSERAPEDDAVAGNENESQPIESMSVSDALEKLLSGDVDAQTEAQAYDAIRWIPVVGDAYSVGRAAYFAMGGDTTEAGLCAVNVIPVVGNVLSTAKRIKDAKDLEGSGDAAKEQEKHLPPMYKKLMGWWDQLAEQVADIDGEVGGDSSANPSGSTAKYQPTMATSMGGALYVRY